MLTWFLGGMSPPDQRRWALITWALFASYAGVFVLALRYFFVVPIVFSALIALLLGIEGFRAMRGGRTREV